MNFTQRIITVSTILLMLFACNTERSWKKSEKTVKEGFRIGNKAPDLAYNNPESNVLTLSSLAGKMVLIEFWASWCTPCRRENPVVVRTYQHFKNSKFKNGEGFTVFSVSLDKEKQAWIQAIERDELSWESHISDLKGWKAQAAIIYNISSIPSNLLIDGDGIIVAKNLRGEQLSATLHTYLKN